MAITAQDIKLLESERMSDTTDGGGRKTSRVIPDGVAGNIFPKVSRLDSVYGRVNLRKIYGAIQTADVDTYAGAHAVITDAPDNDRIHTTLFSTASEFDTRTTARDRIESYVTSGPENKMILLGRQLPGQQTFLAYQRVEEQQPEVGGVFCLSNEPGGTLTTQQYVRIQDVTDEVRTFEDNQGTFQRRVLTVDVGAPLRYEFSGPPSVSRYSDVTRNSKVRDTTVVDAARYFGIKKITETANTNALQIQVEDVYTPIVPTTNRESPVANENISDSISMVSARASNISETMMGTGDTRHTSRGITPGTLVVSGGGLAGSTDNRTGKINTAEFVATVDYESGAITRTGGSTNPTSYTATYTPATGASQPAHTKDTVITLANRGTVYVVTANPLPNPGSVIVDYRALGKWYRLRDNGDGTMTGTDNAYGVGTVDYVSGSVVLTLGALPDIGSSVITSWSSPVHYAIRSAGTGDAAATATQTFLLPDLPVYPNGVSLTYTSGGVTYTATDDANGVITGDGITGTVNYTSGLVQLNYTTRLPDSSTQVSVSYSQVVPTNPLLPVVKSLATSSASVTTLGPNIEPGSVVGSLSFSGAAYRADFSANLMVQDNGVGLLMCPTGQAVEVSSRSTAGAIVSAATIIGSIDYVTGVVTINQSVPINIQVYSGLWEKDTTQSVSVSNGPANWGWRSSTAAGTQDAKTHNVGFIAAPLNIDLTRTVADTVVPGSVMFTVGGKTFIDRNGTIYTDVSTSTGAGVSAGQINYETGTVALTNWVGGATLTVSVISCLTTYGEHAENEFFFRTPGSPIRPGSFYVQVSDTLGNIQSGTSDAAGVITGASVSGTVDQQTGVVRLKFGQMVTAAGRESEPWFNPANVVGGQIFEPYRVQPSTLTYNCVVLSNLPLNADILGLDPVRLPSDGRVPIYRPADVVVVHNTASTTLTNPVVASTTYPVGRTNIAEMWLVDQAGVKVPTTNYTVNLDTGNVTISGTPNLTGLVQPLVAKHRIEDMSLVTDVQINGQITLASPLSRTYPANTSFVSSALLFGDMNARVTNVFDLGAFASWTDTPGTQATAQFNDIDYPIEILNNGGLTERWRVNFTSTNAFQVIGENLGVIATGTTAGDCSPTNTLTGNPYFIIRAAGWGSGWSAGNQLRFNTVGAAAPIWVARTVLPGATLLGDSFSMQMRGDVDA